MASVWFLRSKSQDELDKKTNNHLPLPLDYASNEGNCFSSHSRFFLASNSNRIHFCALYMNVYCVFEPSHRDHVHEITNKYRIHVPLFHFIPKPIAHINRLYRNVHALVICHLNIWWWWWCRSYRKTDNNNKYTLSKLHLDMFG